MTPFRAPIGASSPNAHHFTPPLPTLQHRHAMSAPPRIGSWVPVLSKADLRIDYADEGTGPPVVLIHSSVSGNRQWRALTEALRDRYRVLAAEPLRLRRDHALARHVRPQSLADQAELVLAVCERGRRPGPARRSLLRRLGRAHGRAAAGRARIRPGAARAQSVPPAAAGGIAPPGRDRTACARP